MSRTLADVVVGVALELQGDAGREPGAQRLPGVPAQLDVDRVRRQAHRAKALGHLRRPFLGALQSV